MRLVQLTHPDLGRRIALVEEPNLILLAGPTTACGLARRAIEANQPVAAVAAAARSREWLSYEPIYDNASEWQLLPAFDHPDDPAHCLVSGTGLTHRASADNRERMHQAAAAGQLTDSMRMYLAGVDGGRPASGAVGVQPEWFYKGTGSILRPHGDDLTQPAYADDAGEEPEVVGCYVIDAAGRPCRVGFAVGNEFADHVMEKQNYLYLAHSKLRECAVGPELSLDESFACLTGTVTIRRPFRLPPPGGDGNTEHGRPEVARAQVLPFAKQGGGGSATSDVIWSHAIQSGEEHMAHTLANLEHHHFKYAAHRVPGDVHLHFFGAAAFSFGAQVQLADGDVMEVAWEGLGRPLQNTLRIERGPAPLTAVQSLAGDAS